MKHFSIKLLVASSLVASAFAADSSIPTSSTASNIYGKSRFRDIPVFAINRPIEADAFNLERRWDRECGIQGAFQVVPYYTQSTKNDQDDRASYFLPTGSQSIIVAEQSSTIYKNWQQDVYAQYFKVATSNPTAGVGTQTYSSIVHFAPKTEVSGIGLQYVQNIRHFWLDFTMPIQYVSTDLGICEKQLQAGNNGGTVTAPTGWYPTVVSSWRSGDLRYGRFLPQTGGCLPRGLNARGDKLYRWGVGDLDIRLGWQSIRNDHVFMTGYIGAVVPTARKYDPTFLWDPQLGYAQAGVMWGSSVNILAREFCNGGTLRWMLNVNNRFLFENKQLRSLDLRETTWSRYIQVWKNNTAYAAQPSATTIAADTAPLINYSTLCCKVRPRSALDINTAFVYGHRCFQAELGFNVYGRHTEELILAECLPSGLGLADVDDVAQAGAPSNKFTISQFGWIRGYISPGTTTQIADTNNAGNPTYVPLTSDMLDLSSAAAPGVLAYSVYGSLGYNRVKARLPFFAHVGGVYTFASDNTAVSRWGVFGKIGMSI